MTKVKLYTLIAMLVMLVFPSCAIIEINGLGNDYKDLTESQKALVRPLERFDEAQPGWVYILTMPMLKEELEKQPKAIVRVSNPAIPSDDQLCRAGGCGRIIGRVSAVCHRQRLLRDFLAAALCALFHQRIGGTATQDERAGCAGRTGRAILLF